MASKILVRTMPGDFLRTEAEKMSRGTPSPSVNRMCSWLCDQRQAGHTLSRPFSMERTLSHAAILWLTRKSCDVGEVIAGASDELTEDPLSRHV